MKTLEPLPERRFGGGGAVAAKGFGRVASDFSGRIVERGDRATLDFRNRDRIPEIAEERLITAGALATSQRIRHRGDAVVTIDAQEVTKHRRLRRARPAPARSVVDLLELG